MKIGIIGLGFVGSAIQASHPGAQYYDPAKEGSVTSLADLLHCDVIYVSVPTPMGQTGKCNDSILRETLDTLVSARYSGLVIAKSTAPAETYCPYEATLNLVFMPEFLRAVSATEDYLASTRFIIGGTPDRCILAENILLSSPLLNTRQAKFLWCSIPEACMAKYCTNAFLASKVSIFNEFKLLCDTLDIDWSVVVAGLRLDERIGSDHTEVPGPDGRYGWGGYCFPKDVSALIATSRLHGRAMPILETINDVNLIHRRIPTEYDL